MERANGCLERDEWRLVELCLSCGQQTCLLDSSIEEKFHGTLHYCLFMMQSDRVDLYFSSPHKHMVIKATLKLLWEQDRMSFELFLFKCVEYF